MDDERWARLVKNGVHCQRNRPPKRHWATPNNAIGQDFLANTGEIFDQREFVTDLLKRPNITFDDIAKVSDSTVSAKVGEPIEIRG